MVGSAAGASVRAISKIWAGVMIRTSSSPKVIEVEGVTRNVPRPPEPVPEGSGTFVVFTPASPLLPFEE